MLIKFIIGLNLHGVMKDYELGGGNSKFGGGIEKLDAASIPCFLKRVPGTPASGSVFSSKYRF